MRFITKIVSKEIRFSIVIEEVKGAEMFLIDLEQALNITVNNPK